VRLPYRSLTELPDEPVAWLARSVRNHGIDLLIPADLASAFGAARLQAYAYFRRRPRALAFAA
jgi:hypothetical protein